MLFSRLAFYLILNHGVLSSPLVYTLTNIAQSCSFKNSHFYSYYTHNIHMRFWKCSLAEANCFKVHSQNKLFVLCILNIYNFSSLCLQKTGRRRGPPCTGRRPSIIISFSRGICQAPLCNLPVTATGQNVLDKLASLLACFLQLAECQSQRLFNPVFVEGGNAKWEKDQHPLLC